MCTNKNVKSIYTIAADEVDINLLQFRSYVQNKKQLYSLCNYSSPCYYDVEVMAARRNVIEEVEDDTSTNDEMYKNYKCHICNIDVPIVFFKEHNNSSIHKTYAAIANKAMERIKLQMNVELQAAPTKTPSVHFCDICVLVIKKTDRIEHEKCRIHQISMTHNRILQDLAQIYINNDFKVESNPLNDQNIALKTSDNANAKLQEDDVKTNTEMYVDSVESDSQALESKKINTILENNVNLFESNGNLLDEKKQPDHKVCSGPVKISEIDKDNVIMSETGRIESNKKDHKNVTETDNELKKTCENINNVAVNSKIQNEIDWIDINQYIEEINKINEGNLIVVTKEHKIHITTVSGDIFEVSFAQFCGYTKILSKWACNICQSYIVNDSTDEHEYLEQHVKGILMPLQDKNCLRTLNDVYLHCVLCNVFLPSASKFDHITHESHITRIKDALIYNEKLSKVEHKYELQCQLPDQGTAQALLINVENFEGKYSQTSTEVATTSAQNTDNYRQVQNIVLDKNLEDDAYKKSILSNEHIITLSNTNITETADGNTMKCDVIAAEEHLSGSKHTRKLNPKFLQNNCIVKDTIGYFCNVCYQNGNGTYCEICCVDVGTISNMSTHKKGKEHQQTLKMLNYELDYNTDKVQMESTDDPNVSHCRICKVKVPKNDERQHMLGVKHNIKLVDKLRSNQMCNVAIGYYYCKECKIYSDLGHMFEDAHLSKIYNLSSSTKISIKSDVCHHTDNHLIGKSYKDAVKKPNKKIKNRKQTKATVDFKKLLCQFCNVVVQNTTEEINYHLNSVEHKQNGMKVIDKHLVKMSNSYWCKSCKILISNFIKIKHIFSRRHKKNFAKLVRESKATK